MLSLDCLDALDAVVGDRRRGRDEALQDPEDDPAAKPQRGATAGVLSLPLRSTAKGQQERKKQTEVKRIDARE